MSAMAKGSIVEPDNEIVISPASYWEIAIKNQKGKSWRVSTFSGSAVGLCASRWTAWPAT